MPVTVARNTAVLVVEYPVTSKHTYTLRHTFSVINSIFYLFVYVSGVSGTSQHLHTAVGKPFSQWGEAPGCDWQASRRPDWGVYGVMTGTLRSKEEL